MINDMININWQEFHFLRPLFLWLLVPAFIILLLGLLRMEKQLKWKKSIAPHLRKFVIIKGSDTKLKWIRILTILLFSIGILGLSGPSWKKITIPGQILETPLVIVLDMSQSMMATDIQPNRLDRAKFKIYDLLQANPHARTALIAYAGTAHTIVPLTSDYSIILKTLDGLNPGIMPVPGSNLEMALQLSDTITQYTEAPAHLILFTDDFTDEIFIQLQNFANNGHTSIEIMPMNTLSGADILKPNSKWPFKDKNGNVVHSSLNKPILDKLNFIENIKVNELTLDKSDVELLAASIGAHLKFQENDKTKNDDWEDRGIWFIIPFALLLLFWFRKGWLIFSFFIMLTFSSCKEDRAFKNLWLTKDYQAQQAYNKGRFKQAANLFVNPMHKGTAYYMAEDYEKAIQVFTQDSTAVGVYNLAMAYYKNGDYRASAQSFAKANKINPDLGSALENEELMRQLIAQTDPMDLDEPEEANKQDAQNTDNKDMEDLGGGGQEASKEDMEKERKQETAETGKRKGKELDEVPDDFKSGNAKNMDHIVMQKIDDDPSLFLKRKFKYQIKMGIVKKPKYIETEW